MDAAVTIAQYQERLKALGYADATIVAYRKGLDRFREYLEQHGIIDLRMVTGAGMLDYKAFIMAGTQAGETKALLIRPVKRLFEHLTQNNRLLINPAEGIIETHRRGRKVGATLTREEMQKVLQQPNLKVNSGMRDRAIMELLYATALRIDEALSLDIQDVDLGEGIILVRKGKGKRERVVPLGRHAASFVRQYLEKVRPCLAQNDQLESRLFLSYKGMPLTYGNVRQNFRQYLYEKTQSLMIPIIVHGIYNSMYLLTIYCLYGL